MQFSGLVIICVVPFNSGKGSGKRKQDITVAVFQPAYTTNEIKKEIYLRYNFTRSPVECSVLSLPEEGVFYFVYRGNVCNFHRDTPAAICEIGLTRLPGVKYMRKKFAGEPSWSFTSEFSMKDMNFLSVYGGVYYHYYMKRMIIEYPLKGGWRFQAFEKDEASKSFILRNEPPALSDMLDSIRGGLVEHGLIIWQRNKAKWRMNLYNIETGQYTGRIVWIDAYRDTGDNCLQYQPIALFFVGKSAIVRCPITKTSFRYFFFDQYKEELQRGMRNIDLGEGMLLREVGDMHHPLCARDGIFAMAYQSTKTEISVDVIRVGVKDGDTSLTTNFKLNLDILGNMYGTDGLWRIYVIKNTVLLIFNQCTPTKIFVYNVVERGTGMDTVIEAIPYPGNPIVTPLAFKYRRFFFDNDGNYYDVMIESMTQPRRISTEEMLKVTSVKMFNISELEF
ncbi:uncharacterized protein LOC135491314 isoform X1 [Lineus longissimus]|uniref:uncharacterized protein LOC135491314 isoform X1 n=1 Tax=Lineus longissimus TaxID=88925 RepID=UPI002B4CF154